MHNQDVWLLVFSGLAHQGCEPIFASGPAITAHGSLGFKQENQIKSNQIFASLLFSQH
jgi:hypothetical protein